MEGEAQLKMEILRQKFRIELQSANKWERKKRERNDEKRK